MSVNTSEEYLDELLQAIEPIIGTNSPETATEPEMAMEERTVVEPEVAMNEEVVMELETSQESNAAEEVMESEIIGMEPFSDAGVETYEDDSSAIGDLLTALSADEDGDLDEAAMSEEDIESMLNAVNSQTEDTQAEVYYDQDVKELLKQFSEDEDLSDIQDILDKNDSGEALDESILELPDVEVFQLEEQEADGEEENEESKKENVVGKLVGGFVSFFKKRKEKKGQDKDDSNSFEEIEEESSIEELAIEDEDEIVLMDDMSESDIEELLLDDDLSDIEQLLSGGAFQGEDSSEQEESVNEDTADNKKKKSDKDSKKSRKEKKNKKESIFSKVLNMLTEEVEESDGQKTAGNGGIPEVGETGITNENLNILEELSKEGKKKTKQEKKKSKKNGKNASKKGEDEEADDKAAKGKKAKKVKKKREKKEKPRKVEVITKPEKKLPRKRVLSIFALCFSILAAILILQNVVWKANNLKEAEFAYDNADYETCYMNLSGVERSEEEEELYQKSFIILAVQRKLDSYNNFMQMKNEVEALNSLLEGVVVYKEQESVATEWGVLGQIASIYQTIWEKLQGYGLSEADVEEILGYESKVTYTKRLESIVNGTPFVIEEMMESEVVSEPQPLQDVLPQEEDFLPEDTTDVTSGQVSSSTEEASELEEDSMQGNTVVVGSNPVDISDTVSDVTAGENVGSGSTDVSIELNGDNVVVSDL